MDLLNRQTILMDKYYINDILINSDSQNIYTASIAHSEQTVIINQIPMTSPWQAEAQTLRALGLIDVFCNKDCHFIVAHVHQGKQLKEYILNNDLFLKFKLEVLIDILNLYKSIPQDSPLELKLNLIDINKIVMDNNSVKIDYSAPPSHNKQGSSQQIVTNLVSIIYFIFASTEYQDGVVLEKLPSDITKIINTLLSGRVSSLDFDKILMEIEATTLFRLFYKQTIGEHHEHKEPPHGFINFFKKPKNSFIERKLLKYLLLGAITLVLLTGGYKVIRSILLSPDSDPSVVVDNPSEGRDTDPDNKTNKKPVASFYSNQNQINRGDTVSFFSESYDDDSIQSHLWIVTKDSQPVATSYQDWFFEYTFTSTGNYQVILRVSDTQSESSEDFILDIKVEEGLAANPDSNNQQNDPKNQDWKAMGRSTLAFDSDDYYSGSSSLKIGSDGQNSEFGAMLSIDLTDEKNEFLKGFNTLISIFAKAEANDTQAHLVISEKDISGNTINSLKTTPANLSSQWSKLSTSFKVSNNCHSIEVSIIAQTGTSIWLDNFEIDLIK